MMTVIEVFIFDLASITELWRAPSFLGLGIVLIGIPRNCIGTAVGSAKLPFDKFETGGPHADARPQWRHHPLRSARERPCRSAHARLQRHLPHVGQSDRGLQGPLQGHGMGYARPRPERLPERDRRLLRSAYRRRHSGDPRRLW